MSINIFVNGIQRAGTNYTRQLLETNTDHYICEYMAPYWKHDCFADAVPECDSIICVIKNPYTWIESVCFRNCVDIVDLNAHLYNSTDNIGNFNINLIELCKLYKKFYTSWIDHGVTLVHYENLLDQQYIKMFLNKNLDIIKDGIKIPEDVTWSANFEKKQIRSYKDYELFYLSQTHIDVINEQFGDVFFNLIQYPIK